ncbi:uncharacterized protein LOC120266696 isoform X2 [Dioscorea cayenensis subsp. rotundata]|uniref:Uncharacterized protein LOC120266696 isoform X2 n=1 Tax=Dioscorea cayennensis subsp. rotundata TaxID=55577 RepID=A0AB40BV21_DIOCR|nr:uncharacterized protein LOC120266696 isoform X2 [Dioscorea cayenensis subsp. rotundata]
MGGIKPLLPPLKVFFPVIGSKCPRSPPVAIIAYIKTSECRHLLTCKRCGGARHKATTYRVELPSPQGADKHDQSNCEHPRSCNLLQLCDIYIYITVNFIASFSLSLTSCGVCGKDVNLVECSSRSICGRVLKSGQKSTWFYPSKRHKIRSECVVDSLA